MNALIYNCCEGKVSDIKALEGSTYFEFCAILDNFLQRVDKQNKEYEKMRRENNLKSKVDPKRRGSMKAGKK